MYPGPIRNHPASGQGPAAARTEFEFAQLLPGSWDPQIRSATLFPWFSTNASRETKSVPNSAVSLRAASQKRAILGSLRSGSKVETRERRPVSARFQTPQFSAQGKYSLETWIRISPSGPRCWRRRGVTRSRPGMRAVAAAAAAATGAVTAFGGTERGVAWLPKQSLVQPAGSSLPNSCAPVAGRPCPERLPPPRTDPANSPLTNLANRRVTAGGEPRGGGESALLRPDPHSVRASASKSSGGVLEPLWGFEGLGTAPERPAGVDGTSLAVPGRERKCGTGTGWVS